MAISHNFIPYLCTIPGFIILGFLFPLLVGNEILRAVISTYLKFKHGDKFTLVSDGVEALWRPKRTVAITLMRTDKSVNLEIIKNWYENNIRCAVDSSTGRKMYEKMEKIITTKYGYACWETDENFDIIKQCRFHENKIFYKKNLTALIKDLEMDMGKDKPQWEFVVVPKYQSRNKTDLFAILLLR